MNLMAHARLVAENSYAKRRKVGAIISRDGRIVSTGYNGTPSGFDNTCEENNKTKDNVIHAEVNALYFAAKHGLQTQDCDLFVTLSPCSTCALAIIQAGIKSVQYDEKYRDDAGLLLLAQAGITTNQTE